jgi:hypothetical protein
MVSVTIERHVTTPERTSNSADWCAMVNIPEGKTQYGGYGASPLEAVCDLAETLAKIVGYERTPRQEE